LDREMDGRFDRTGCEVGEEICDICRGLFGGRKRKRVTGRSDEEEEEEEQERGGNNEGHFDTRSISEGNFPDSGLVIEDDITAEEDTGEEQIVEEEIGKEEIDEEEGFHGMFRKEVTRYEQRRIIEEGMGRVNRGVDLVSIIDG